ncbi:MAG: molybdopterin biosynthesis protein [Ignisphaera sp.]
MRRLFHKLVSLNEAIEIIEHNVSLSPRGIEQVNILDSLGRVLAVDVYASIDYPPFDRSEVDGYAVKAEDTYGAYESRPVRLQIIGSLKVGEIPQYDVARFKAVEIATGAVMPRGCNSVVMEEYTSREDDYVYIYRAVSPLENVAIAGSDISRGELVLMKGTRITPFDIGILAALGYSSIDVYLKPRIAVISTGNEIAEPGQHLRYGQVYDYNGFAVTSYLRSIGADAYYLGIVPDDREILKSIVTKALEEYDIIITSGGTSAGIDDVVYRVIEDVGTILVHGLEVKPGKPTVIGVSRGKIIMGLPGFPFSAISVSITLLRYIVEKLSGIESPNIYSNLKARITQRIRKDAGKTLYIPIAIARRNSDYIAIPIPYRSGSITPIIRADGVAVVGRGIEIVEEGEEVDIVMFNPVYREAVFIGSHDVILPLLIKHANIMNRVKLLYVGSLAGLINVAKGYGDIAPIHLLHPESKEYNLPYVMQYKDLVLLSGYRRRLVIAFQRGNPKGIKSVRDFIRSDIRIVNRNQGSGTRTILDIMLKELAKELGISFENLIKKIDGYTYEVTSHTGVAAAIAQGRADVGICVEYAAILYNLDYMPLTWEEYDFAIHRDSLDKPVITKFIEFLKSGKTLEILKSIPGYDVKSNIGEIVYG